MLTFIRDILANFHDATKATESRKSTLDLTLPTIDFIIQMIEEALVEFNYHDAMRESLQAALTKITHYWNRHNLSPVYIAAIALDPRRKWNYFKRWETSWAPNMKRQMRHFWEQTYRSSTGMTRQTPSNEPKQIQNRFLQ